MRLRTKFFCSFAAVAVVMVAVSIALFVTTRDLSNARATLDTSTELQARLGTMKQLVYEYSRFNAARSEQQWNVIVGQLLEQSATLTDRDGGHVEGAEALSVRLNSASMVFLRLQDIYRNPDFSERRRKVVVGKLIATMNSAMARVDEIIVNARALEQETGDRNIYMILCMLGVFVLAAIGILSAMVTQILPSVDRIMNIAGRIGEGDIKSEVMTQRDDEFGDIETSLEAMRRNLEKNHRQLDDARREAEVANEAKTQFLANMSHELRTPLNAVIGFSDMLVMQRQKVLDAEKIRDYAGSISQAGYHLLDLINDLLDFAKIEAREVELSRESFAIREEVGSIRSVFEVLAQENQVELEVVENGPAVVVNGDPVRFRQVLYNLVSNAIKFSAGGAVRIKTSSERIGDGRIALEINVHDNGIGVPHDRLDAIFNPFSQSDSSITRRFGGTGLGLPISRTLARLMGGDVTVESEPGVGSTFTATFVFEDVSTVVDAVGPTCSQTPGNPIDLGLSVIAVDDISSNREVIQVLLADLGCKPVVFENASDAIAWISNNDVDAVMMDINMPDVDGITAAREIRKLPCETRNVPIFAWTADVTSPELRMDGVDWAGKLTKPVTREALALALCDVVPRNVAA